MLTSDMDKRAKMNKIEYSYSDVKAQLLYFLKILKKTPENLKTEVEFRQGRKM